MLKQYIKELILDVNTRKQLLNYLIIGSLTALLELVLFVIQRKVLHFDITLSNVIAIVSATTMNFLLNRGWAFKSAANLPKSFFLYAILFLLNMTISTNGIKLMVQVGVSDIIAKVLTMMLITTWNFILYKKVIFR